MARLPLWAPGRLACRRVHGVPHMWMLELPDARRWRMSGARASDAKARVERRDELRRLAAEHARATISREWLEHYAAQFLERDDMTRGV